MTDEMDFSGQYEHEVEIHHDSLGDIGKGTLSFGSEHWPHVSFKDWHVSARLGEGTHRRIRATTSDGEVFSLFNCKVTGFGLSADYVIAGDVNDEFKCIKVRFTDIFDWFMPFRSYEDKINPDSERNAKQKQLEVVVKTEKQAFKLSSQPILITSGSGEDHLIHEHILFSFERLDTDFRLEDLKNRIHELSTLLSILIAYPTSIASVRVTCEDGRSHGVFFPSPKKKERKVGREFSWNEGFISKHALDDCWQSVFDRYYRSEYREVLWVRLAGMQRYEGFWEYSALGYVSLLDKYVSQRSVGQKKAASKKELVKDDKLKTALQALAPPLAETQIEGLLLIIDKFFMGGKKLNFRQKYDYVLSVTDAEIIKIVNLSDSDFNEIKKIRDAVAHGDAPQLIDSDYSRVGIIVSKIALLLTYWAFLDFGIGTDKFLTCLVHSHSSLKLRAVINRLELTRTTRPDDVFSVPSDQFEKFSKIKGIQTQACFTQDGGGKIEYSEQQVAALREWYKKGISGILPVDEIFGAPTSQIRCVGHGYIECGNDTIELIQAYIIKID